MASGHGAPHQQAGHMAAPTSLASPSKKTLAKGEPSTHGTLCGLTDMPKRRPVVMAELTKASGIPLSPPAF
jgi:hypothetical protein